MSAVTVERLSDTIGLIYDSAVDPGAWPTALEAMCGLVDGFHGSIAIYDLAQHRFRLATDWCADPEWPRWKKLLDETYAAQMPFYALAAQQDIDSVCNTSMMAAMLGRDLADLHETPFFKEWALPSGHRDVLNGTVMKSGTRYGTFNLHTSTSRDLTTPQELEICTLLAPHVRRAITIGDLFDVVASKATSLQATLDTLNAPVLVTDVHARVVHANRAGEAMLRDGGPLRTEAGRLTAGVTPVTNALQTAISRSADPVKQIGGVGIGVPLRTPDGSPSLAHVLPLSRGGPKRDGGPTGQAAVFVSPADHVLPEADALMGLFGLTQMEARVLLQVAAGKRRAEAANELGIADSTAKTHLERVYQKTGVGDQAALARLVAALGSPAGTRG